MRVNHQLALVVQQRARFLFFLVCKVSSQIYSQIDITSSLLYLVLFFLVFLFFVCRKVSQFIFISHYHIIDGRVMIVEKKIHHTSTCSNYNICTTRHPPPQLEYSSSDSTHRSFHHIISSVVVFLLVLFVFSCSGSPFAPWCQPCLADHPETRRDR